LEWQKLRKKLYGSINDSSGWWGGLQESTFTMRNTLWTKGKRVMLAGPKHWFAQLRKLRESG
jgi:hypothetical protein